MALIKFNLSHKKIQPNSTYFNLLQPTSPFWSAFEYWAAKVITKILLVCDIKNQWDRSFIMCRGIPRES